MASKRELEDLLEQQTAASSSKKVKFDDNIKKHTLDSDEEEENEEKYNVMDDNEFEGEEEGANRQDGETRLTAFNMKEEMEEGHFDRDGHFIWNNEKEIKDNWLDNIDWHKVKDGDTNPYELSENKGLGDSDSEDEGAPKYDEIEVYKKVLKYLQPKETINKALKRLGGDVSKLSSIERLKRKKAGTLGSSKEVTELTELANQILTETGNMDVYQETYESITKKVDKSLKSATTDDFDMFSDNFDSKKESSSKEDGEVKEELKWEFKWEQDGDKIDGPHTTEQMHKWSQSGHFKTGVWVRKCGVEDTNFYSSNRIDFELYM